MEAKDGASAEQHNTIKYYYTKRHLESATTPEVGQMRFSSSGQRLSLASLSHAISCKETYYFCSSLEVGGFYEIDHEKLPPKSPIQLKAVRVVKVSEARELDVTVSFPSILSLRNYFALSPDPGREPELDERFVMSSNQASKILRCLISPEEVDDEKHLEGFWLVSSSLQDFSPLVTPTFSIIKKGPEGTKRPALSADSCLLSMKRAGLAGWGTRKKVTYRWRARGTAAEEKEDESQVDGEPHPRNNQLLIMQHGQRHDEEEEDECHSQNQQQDKLPRHGGTKRKRLDEKKCKKYEKRFKEKKRKKKLPEHVNETKKSNVKKVLKEKGSKDRWSSDRYESAELKLLDIMKCKDARLGKPVMRQELREEARKHIGDTGLLDHLLKHMSGKVVMDGELRFRRRHNSEGQMEYWLEPAELMEIRKKAGVLDLCWVPPPGWKPGDSTSVSPCSGECKTEMCQLKEEIANLRRDVELLGLKDDERSVKAANSDICEHSLILQTILEKNTKLEEEVAELTNSLLGLKEEVRLLKEEDERRKSEIMEKEKEVAKENKSSQYEQDGEGKGEQQELETVQEANQRSSTNIAKSSLTNSTTSLAINADASTNDNKKKIRSSPNSSSASKKTTRRSGFRICKPQGTFLWPDMACATRATSPCRVSSSSAAAAAGAGVPQLLSLSPTSSSRRSPVGVGGDGKRGDHLLFPAATSVPTSMTTSAAAVEEQLMLVGGVPTPNSTTSTATSAQRFFLVPGPLSPGLARAPQGPEMAMAILPSPNHAQRRHMLQEIRGSCTYDQNNVICCTSHVYQSHSHIVTRITSSTPCDGDGKIKGSDASTMVSPTCQAEKKKIKGNVTTDLALATPSTSSYD